MEESSDDVQSDDLTLEDGTRAEQGPKQTYLKETEISNKSEIADTRGKYTNSKNVKTNSKKIRVKQEKSNDIEDESNTILEKEVDKAVKEKCASEDINYKVISAEEVETQIDDLHCIEPQNITLQQFYGPGKKGYIDINLERNVSDLNTVSKSDKDENMLPEKFSSCGIRNDQMNQQIISAYPNIHCNFSINSAESESSSKDISLSKIQSDTSLRQEKEIINSQSSGTILGLNNYFRTETTRAYDDIEKHFCEVKLEANSSEHSIVSTETNEHVVKALNEKDSLNESNQQILDAGEVNNLDLSNSSIEEYLSSDFNSGYVSPKNRSLFGSPSTKNIYEQNLDSECTKIISGVNLNQRLEIDLKEPLIFPFDNINFYTPKRQEGVNDDNISSDKCLSRFGISPERDEQVVSDVQNFTIFQDDAETSVLHDHSKSSELNTQNHQILKSSKYTPCSFTIPEEYEVKKDRSYQKRFYRLHREGKLNTLLNRNSVEHVSSSSTISQASPRQDSAERERSVEDSNKCENEGQLNEFKVTAEQNIKSRTLSQIVPTTEDQEFRLTNLPPLEMRVPNFAVESDKHVNTYENNSCVENFSNITENDSIQIFPLKEIAELYPKRNSNVYEKSLDICYYIFISFNFEDGYTEEPSIFLRDRLYEPSGSETVIPLRPIFRILRIYHNDGEELSVEEMFYLLGKVEKVYYEAKLSKRTGNIYTKTIKCCKIPIKKKPECDEDYDPVGNKLILRSSTSSRNCAISESEKFQHCKKVESEIISGFCTDNRASAEATPESILEDHLKIGVKKSKDGKPYKHIEKEIAYTSSINKTFKCKQPQFGFEYDQTKVAKRKRPETSDGETCEIFNKTDKLNIKINTENSKSGSNSAAPPISCMLSKIAKVEDEFNEVDGKTKNYSISKALLESIQTKISKRKHPESSDNEKSENGYKVLSKKDKFAQNLDSGKCKVGTQNKIYKNRICPSKPVKMFQQISEADKREDSGLFKVLEAYKISNTNIQQSTIVKDSASSVDKTIISKISDTISVRAQESENKSFCNESKLEDENNFSNLDENTNEKTNKLEPAEVFSSDQNLENKNLKINIIQDTHEGVGRSKSQNVMDSRKDTDNNDENDVSAHHAEISVLHSNAKVFYPHPCDAYNKSIQIQSKSVDLKHEKEALHNEVLLVLLTESGSVSDLPGEKTQVTEVPITDATEYVTISGIEVNDESLEDKSIAPGKVLGDSWEAFSSTIDPRLSDASSTSIDVPELNLGNEMLINELFPLLEISNMPNQFEQESQNTEEHKTGITQLSLLNSDLGLYTNEADTDRLENINKDTVKTETDSECEISNKRSFGQKLSSRVLRKLLIKLEPLNRKPASASRVNKSASSLKERKSSFVRKTVKLRVHTSPDKSKDDGFDCNEKIYQNYLKDLDRTKKEEVDSDGYAADISNPSSNENLNSLGIAFRELYQVLPKDDSGENSKS